MVSLFAGVSSEVIGSMLAGWEEIVGIEMSEEYCEIGRKRIEYWRRKSPDDKKVKAKVVKEKPKQNDSQSEQQTLF